jgi:hypothetical protein
MFKTYAPYISDTGSELVIDDHEATFISNPEEAKYFIFGNEVRGLFKGLKLPYKQTLISDILKENNE